MLTVQDDRDEEVGNRRGNRRGCECMQREMMSPVCNGRAIVKETTIDVSFKVTEGESVNADGTRRRDEMWLAKELPKIPWEAHIQNQR